ncbi:oligopeptide/dipeptide ABC transporter ATP-binding protein [Mahella sp.]|uniref:ABC transporter ATP-binding protein n=1 Tax=Mahella sp. TaxID=2798721 RepID=UPI0025BD2CDF|nr:oligopeptide/dipeptide ABC transporter ATP-binding protein [Mahella sp.]MBZ4664936.1 oligopeptide/dipeptide transporter, ATPase subunit [Mahella sp.]MDK2903841.1 oligopeptide transport system ATP-binding protein [Clostridiales bacterium]
MKEQQHLLEVKHLKKYFSAGHNTRLKAVDDVSFYIDKGETFGLVGESGCGKSTTGRTIARLYEPTDGEIWFDGRDVVHLSGNAAKQYTKLVQMIFQDPYASLNPRMTVGDIIAEGIDIHGLYSGKRRQERIYELLEMVGLNEEHASRFPHEFSGGQRQRIGIARALAIEPQFIICDEPISALDVSIQAQIVNLLEQLQHELGLTYLFIAHDLSMVKHISNRVAVMYLGSIVETAPSSELYKNPLHPYTQALMSAIPIPDPDIEASRQRILLEGDVPSPINTPPGCKFCGRCPKAMPICAEKAPLLEDKGSGHSVACYLYK